MNPFPLTRAVPGSDPFPFFLGLDEPALVSGQVASFFSSGDFLPFSCITLSFPPSLPRQPLVGQDSMYGVPTCSLAVLTQFCSATRSLRCFFLDLAGGSFYRCFPFEFRFRIGSSRPDFYDWFDFDPVFFFFQMAACRDEV